MRKSTLFIIFIFCLALSAYPFSQPFVRIDAEARVDSEIVLLGDIAQVSGNEVDVKRIRRISLGYAPNVGAVRQIRREKIALAIAAAGFMKNEYSLQAPPLIQISRAGQTIESAQLDEKIKESIFGKFKDVEIDFVKIDLPLAFEVPLGEVEFNPKFASVRNLLAPFSLPIEIRVNKRIVKRISIDVELIGYAEVFVAKRGLPANYRLQRSDVLLERVQIKKPITKYLRAEEDLRGIKLVKDLNLGSVLSNDTYVADVVVKSGDLVRIVGQSGRLKVVVNGKARGSGRIGDRISVKNLQSNKIIQATITDEGLVKVSF